MGTSPAPPHPPRLRRGTLSPQGRGICGTSCSYGHAHITVTDYELQLTAACDWNDREAHEIFARMPALG